MPELGEAVRLERRFAEAHYGLSDLLAMANDMDGVIAELRKSIHLRPDLQMLRLHGGVPLQAPSATVRMVVRIRH